MAAVMFTAFVTFAVAAMMLAVFVLMLSATFAVTVFSAAVMFAFFELF